MTRYQKQRSSTFL